MKCCSLVKIVVMVFSFGLNAWSLDRYSRSHFDVDNLRYEFKADQDCEISNLRGYTMSFRYDQQSTIRVLVDGIEYTNYSPIEYLNLGKREYSSCIKDGFNWYQENEFYNARIVKRTVARHPGFLCSGKQISASEEITFEFVKNKLIIRVVTANYDKQFAKDQTCSFTRIQF